MSNEERNNDKKKERKKERRRIEYKLLKEKKVIKIKEKKNE